MRAWASLFDEFRGYPRRLWLVCLAAYVTVQIEFALWSLALPALRAEFGLSSSEVGFLTGLTFALGGLLVVGLSILADRFGRRLMLIVGTSAAAVFSALHVVATGLVALAVVRTCAIGFSGLVFPSTGALVAEEAPARIRGLMVGLLQIAVPLGWLLAAIIGAIVLDDWGWRALFLAAILGVPAALFVHLYIRESPLVQPSAGGQWRLARLFAAGMWRRTVPLFLAQGCFALAFGGGFILMPLYLHDELGFGPAEAGVLVAVANAMGLLGYLATAWVGEFHWTRRNTIAVATFAAAVAFAVFVLFARGHLAVLAAYALLTFFLLGTSAVKFPYIAELYPSELRATGIAFASSLAIHCGLAFGPAIVGSLVDHVGWSQALLLGGAVPLLLASGLFLLLQPLPSGLEMREIESRLRQER
ncbi:MAG: MFS transporter [Gammaproteobacteria bacterium]